MTHRFDGPYQNVVAHLETAGRVTVGSSATAADRVKRLISVVTTPEAKDRFTNLLIQLSGTTMYQG